MQDTEDEPLFVQRVAGLDIAKAEVEVAIRVPSDTTPGRRGRMRPRIRQLEEALDCSFFTSEHAAVLAMMLATIDHYTARIEALTEPCLHQIAQLDEIHGIGQISAQDIIAEIGTDMTVFPTASHLVSWARWSPQAKQSAGKGSNATGRGNPYLSAALGEAAVGAGRTQSFPGARYRRLTRRMPKKKALVATGNSMLTIIHALLSDPGARYTDLGPDYHETRMHVRQQARNHVRGLERPGYQVTIQAPPTPATPSPRPADPPPPQTACPTEVSFSDQRPGDRGHEHLELDHQMTLGRKQRPRVYRYGSRTS